MESGEGLRSRTQALKSIRTKTADKGRLADAKDNRELVEEEPLSPSARLFHEPNFNVYIIAIVGCKTKIHEDVVRANLLHTLLKHPRFSSLQVPTINIILSYFLLVFFNMINGVLHLYVSISPKEFMSVFTIIFLPFLYYILTERRACMQVGDDKGDMKWVRTKVDLDKHLRVPDLNPDVESGDQFVEDYVYNLSKTTIDRSQQPLWDLHLLNVKTSDAEAVGIFRIHHSLGDGTSLISLLLACTRKTSDPSALPTVPVKKKKEKSRSNPLWLSRCFIGLWWICRLFWHTVVDVFMFIATAMFLKDTETPLKGPPGVEFTPRRIVHRTVSLDDIKLVKNAMHMVINNSIFRNPVSSLLCFGASVKLLLSIA